MHVEAAFAFVERIWFKRYARSVCDERAEPPVSYARGQIFFNGAARVKFGVLVRARVKIDDDRSINPVSRAFPIASSFAADNRSRTCSTLNS